MFNSPVLDLVILLTFIYFTGSLILSAVNEAVASSLRLRPKQLKQSLENLFFGDGWKIFVQGTLIKSPHLESLMKAKGIYPSYIPPENFVLAVIGEIGAANYSPDNILPGITNSNLPQEFKDVLTDLYVQADRDLITFEKNLGNFYNNAMDRAGGVYKKKIRIILVIFGFIIAVSMNLDTIQIARDSLANKQALSQSVDKMVSELPNIKLSKDSLAAFSINTKNGVITIPQQSAAKDTSHPDSTMKQKIKAVNDLRIYMQENSGISMGYTNGAAFKQKWIECTFGDFLLSLLGVLITTFALQMSSNFWFDLMNKAVNIRAAGKKPETDKD